MYYLIFIPLYLVSLLPFPVLYFLGDAVYGILYYIIGYRKEVVMGNLKIAFPEKSDAERKKIAKRFYHNFVDNFIETLKLFSLSKKAFEKRWESDLSGFEAAYKTGKSIHVISMHNFNWEFANWGIPKEFKYPFVVIYMPITNKAFDKIMKNMRSKFGSILIPATNFKRHSFQINKQLHGMANVGDQAPGNPAKAYWLNFFGRPTAFVTGPEKGARINDVAVVFCTYFKTRRGHYRLETEFITADPRSLPEGELTRKYAKYIEDRLRERPDNYLWSHRRWKHDYREEYGKLL